MNCHLSHPLTRKHPLQIPCTRRAVHPGPRVTLAAICLLLLADLLTAAPAADLFTKTSIPGWDGTFRSVQAGALTQAYHPSANNSDWADYDNDGLLDLFFPTAWFAPTNTLLHGRADGTFEAVASNPITTDRTPVSNDSIWGDLDNDGDLDVIARGDSTYIFLNDGTGVFTRAQSLPAAGPICRISPTTTTTEIWT